MGKVIHIFSHFIHHCCLLAWEKSPTLGKIPHQVIPSVWKMWISYPHFLGITAGCSEINLC